MNVGLNDPSLMVVPEGRVERVDVFANAAGGITIRQADSFDPNAPNSVTLFPEHIDAVVAALLRVKGEAHR